MLLRDVVWLGIASKLSLLSPYTTLRPISSRFVYPLPPPWAWSWPVVKSEGTTKARRRQSVSTFDIVISKKPQIKVPLFQKKSGSNVAQSNVATEWKQRYFREQRKPTFFAEPKQRHEVKWHMMTITITIGVKPLFTPHLTSYKINTLTDSYMSSDVKC